MIYAKLTRCLRFHMEIDGDCLQPKEKAVRPGSPYGEPYEEQA